ncbi:MAG: hypothetical protein H6737_23850 [Alphaproteobacteria bacterium]|nr:hypothetical protein [Alphaproteobacteria bacterium]
MVDLSDDAAAVARSVSADGETSSGVRMLVEDPGGFFDAARNRSIAILPATYDELLRARRTIVIRRGGNRVDEALASVANHRIEPLSPGRLVDALRESLEGESGIVLDLSDDATILRLELVVDEVRYRLDLDVAKTLAAVGAGGAAGLTVERLSTGEALVDDPAGLKRPAK